MNILFISRLYYPHIGGIERHLEELAQKLIRKGHKITVLTTNYKSNLKDVETVNGIKIIRFNQPAIKYIGILYTWYWLLVHRNLIIKCDILHIHDVFIWYWPFKLLYPGKKVYLTIHGQWGNYPLSPVDILQKRIGSRLADGVITIGEYINKNYNLKSDEVKQ